MTGFLIGGAVRFLLLALALSLLLAGFLALAALG